MGGAMATGVSSQRPIQEPAVTLEKFRKSYQKYKWLFFPFNEIQPSTVAKLKKQFLEDYPSEVLTTETMPSTLDADSGLRPPNVLEAQAADKALWQMIHDLVLDQQFTLDNAIHEDLQKDVANQKAKANKEAKRAKHLLAQPGSQKRQCKANGNSYVCSSNRASVKKGIPAVSAICAPIHWRRDKHAANLIVRLTISSNHTDSYRDNCWMPYQPKHAFQPNHLMLYLLVMKMVEGFIQNQTGADLTDQPLMHCTISAGSG
ncbi:unnamed protein product, partial [Cladocopium goreaui]